MSHRQKQAAKEASVFIVFEALFDEVKLLFFFESIIIDSKSALTTFATSTVVGAIDAEILDVIEIVNFDCFHVMSDVECRSSIGFPDGGMWDATEGGECSTDTASETVLR